MENDEELFRHYCDGDETAISELVNRYGDSITLYLCAIIGDLQDAEDLMVEAFSRVCARRPFLRDGGFCPYLYRTARNLALRFLERNRLRRHFGFDDLPQEPADEILTEELIQTRLQRQTLRLCMNQLHPDYREALYLVYFREMQHTEAAAVMGKTVKQLDNLVFRGRKALRALLEKEGITDAQYF